MKRGRIAAILALAAMVALAGCQSSEDEERSRLNTDISNASAQLKQVRNSINAELAQIGPGPATPLQIQVLSNLKKQQIDLQARIDTDQQESLYVGTPGYSGP
jgi:predicted component of type VI protein secretion system